MKKTLWQTLACASCVLVAGTAFADDKKKDYEASGQNPGQNTQIQQQHEGKDLHQQADQQKAVDAKPEELASNPAKFLGKKVKLEAQVESSLNAHWFTLEGDDSATGPELLVMVIQPKDAVPKDQKLTVSGKVVSLVRADIERHYGWFDLQPDIEIRMAKRPVIIAESIKTEDGKELVLQRGEQPSDAVGAPGQGIQKETEEKSSDLEGKSTDIELEEKENELDKPEEP